MIPNYLDLFIIKITKNSRNFKANRGFYFFPRLIDSHLKINHLSIILNNFSHSSPDAMAREASSHGSHSGRPQWADSPLHGVPGHHHLPLLLGQPGWRLWPICGAHVLVQLFLHAGECDPLPTDALVQPGCSGPVDAVNIFHLWASNSRRIKGGADEFKRDVPKEWMMELKGKILFI